MSKVKAPPNPPRVQTSLFLPPPLLLFSSPLFAHLSCSFTLCSLDSSGSPSSACLTAPPSALPRRLLQSKATSKVEVKKFQLDCSVPADDEILDVAHFEEFLKQKIKVDGKTGNLGNRVTVKRGDGNGNNNIITVEAQTPFSKR